MLFFSTSNAAPWIGAKREGENLFTASIVSLNAETGKYNCHFQEVHHDLWDYDAPRPTVLMTGEMNGEIVEAVGEPEKTGWAYVVDQENCEPVYPIPEVKVPQDPSQKTFPTQPEPTMEPFSPVEATPEAVEKAEEAVATSKAGAEDRRQQSVHADVERPELDQPGRQRGRRWRQLAAVLVRPGSRHVLRLLAGRRPRARRAA